MNEPASVRRRSYFSFFSRLSYRDGFFVGQFCVYPCDDPFAQAVANDVPPPRTAQAPNPDTPIFADERAEHAKRGAPNHSGDDLLNPPYAINNTAGPLSSRTAYVGLSLPDGHSLHAKLTRRMQFMPMGSLSMIRVSPHFYKIRAQAGRLTL
jgi:hypothetical protein